MTDMKRFAFVTFLSLLITTAYPENGYRLWLRYDPVGNQQLLNAYRKMIGGAYFDVNLSFYRDVPQLGEKEFKFNIRTVPVVLQATKRIGFSRLYGGLKYLFS